jgi:hypothetical protein
MPAGCKRASSAVLDSPVKPGNDKNVVLLMNSLVIKQRVYPYNSEAINRSKELLMEIKSSKKLLVMYLAR